MEAIGLAASIIALLELGEKLRRVANSMTLTGKLSAKGVSITSAIVCDLQAIHDCLTSKFEEIPMEAGNELRDACSELELGLAGCLDKCWALHAKVASKGKRFTAVFYGPATADVLNSLQDIESNANNLRRRFSMTGLLRVELAVSQGSVLNEQFRVEMNQRLDFIEEHLKLRISKAEAQPDYADTLLGISRMSGATMQSSLEQTSTDLKKSTSAIEAQYLRVKIQMLQDTLRKRSLAPNSTEEIEDSNMCSTTHQHAIDDPAEQIEDVISQSIALLRTLRSPDIPFLKTVAGLEDLCKQMLDLGMYEDARQTYVQIVHMYRAAIQDDSPPSQIDARLARAIIGLCATLSRLGSSQEALEYVEEAVAIFRDLFKHNTVYKAELSVALNNMANYSRDAGEILPAVSIINEAVMLREELASSAPELYMADLAASLLNASTCYSKLPYLHEQALQLAERAVQITRELTQNNPGLFLPHLAAALHNRANRREARWQNIHAYNDIKEAMEIRRMLAASRPDVYGGGLIRSLTVGKALARKCQDVAAEAVFQRELQRLCKTDPDHHDIPINRAPQISVPFHLDQRYKSRIRYHGSGNIATPYIMGTANTCIDQIMSARIPRGAVRMPPVPPPCRQAPPLPPPRNYPAQQQPFPQG
ncbi:hypothetical protein DFH06DRAFT_1083613 [Mycena polygramma]|nr:hypothetical protein DFH06DRAFT_1103402 [Mycena polygramma]KAJ7669967.1 hypothetical protein DFH06DRAFT_1083613 [Mycena polygramma]